MSHGENADSSSGLLTGSPHQRMCSLLSSKEARFRDLVAAVHSCSLCPRLVGRSKILSPDNGDLEAKVLFVAEAPGRLGADRTGVPLSGDRTGDNFEALLDHISWRREAVFITNAVLCNPRTAEGRNRAPTRSEIDNCSNYLRMTIDLVEPQVVVALGTVALNALRSVSPHRATLKEHAATAVRWFGRLLVPLYHPGPRALIHRSLGHQQQDYSWLSKLVDPRDGVLV